MKISIIAVLILLFACTNKKKQKATIEKEDPIIELKAKLYADSLIKASYKNALFDTVGLSLAPVRVLSSKLFREEYATSKSIRLSYKNVSGKRINGIKFRWYGLNVFGEPADMGTSLTQGFGQGFTDDPLGPGKSTSGIWSIYSRDGNKVVLAWPYEVAFADGTKWEL